MSKYENHRVYPHDHYLHDLSKSLNYSITLPSPSKTTFFPTLNEWVFLALAIWRFRKTEDG